MKTQRFLIVLTMLNLVLLVYLLIVRREANTGAMEVLRGKALEIVDGQGRVRASIKVHPASTFEPTGKAYPETVMLRLIDPQGRPEVKIGASEEGGDVGLVGKSDTTHVLLQAEGKETLLKLTNEDGKEQVVKP